MASKKTLEQRKKMLQEVLEEQEKYQHALDRIRELEKKLATNDNSGKLALENTKLKDQLKAIKATATEVQKKCTDFENDKKKNAEKLAVLKQEIYKKDQALTKYKLLMATTEGKTENGKGDVEIQLQLAEKNKVIAVLKEQISNQIRLFAGADEWAQKCKSERDKLIEEVAQLKGNEKHDNSDAFAKILSLEEVIIDRERELKEVKTLSQKLYTHYTEAQAMLGEIPKLESKIQLLQSQLNACNINGNNGFDSASLFSKPPPTPMNPYNFNMNIPPPPIAKPMQKAAPVFAPVQSQLGDLEKQMANMAAEITRLKQMNGMAKPADQIPRK